MILAEIAKDNPDIVQAAQQKLRGGGAEKPVTIEIVFDAMAASQGPGSSSGSTSSQGIGWILFSSPEHSWKFFTDNHIRYKLLNAASWLFSSCHLIYRKLTPPLYPPYFNIILPVTKQENYRNHENEKRTTASRENAIVVAT